MDSERMKGREGKSLINDCSFPCRRMFVFPSCVHRESQKSEHAARQHGHAKQTSVFTHYVIKYVQGSKCTLPHNSR